MDEVVIVLSNPGSHRAGYGANLPGKA